jgi:GMP synthase PP-ATPase subunit
MSLATRFETSTRGSRWRALLTPVPTLSREEIERDAAEQLGVPVDLLGETPAPVPGHEVRRSRGRLTAWLRDAVSPEPATVRRQRLEAEAAAELGLHDGPEQQAG